MLPGYHPNQPYYCHTDNGAHRHAISVAETVIDEDQKAIVVLEAGCPFALNGQNYGDGAFISEISTCQPLKLEPSMSTWRHREKQTAQDVLPFLALGPMSAARDSDFVKRNGYTMLLAVRDGHAAAINPRVMNPARFASADGIKTATFDVYDEFHLIQNFRSVIRQMNDHLFSQTKTRPITRLSHVSGKILVFCEAGDKRSPAVVILYLMVVFGLSANSAIQAVQARRYGISVNGELLRLIQNCGDILRAERDTCAAEDLNSIARLSTTKRPRKQSTGNNYGQNTATEIKFDSDNYSHRVGMEPFMDFDIGNVYNSESCENSAMIS